MHQIQRRKIRATRVTERFGDGLKIIRTYLTLGYVFTKHSFPYQFIWQCVHSMLAPENAPYWCTLPFVAYIAIPLTCVY